MRKGLIILFAMLLLVNFSCKKEIKSTGENSSLFLYGDARNSRIINVIGLKDGGYLLIGEWSEGGYFFQNRKDGWMVRISSDGTKLWGKKYGTERQDVLTSAVELADGSIVACGYTASIGVNATGVQFTDGWLLKVNALGVEIWSKSVPGGMSGANLKGIYSEEFTDIVLTPENTFLLCGSSGSYKDSGSKPDPSLAMAAWLVEADEDGNYLWEKAYQSTGKYDRDRFNRIILTNNEIYCAFNSYSPNGRSPEYGFIRWKKNAKGVEPDLINKGTHVFSGLLTFDAESSDIVLEDNGDVAVGGYEPELPDNAYLIKFDNTGSELSFKYLASQPLVVINNFQKTDVGYMYSGEYRASSAGISDALLINTDIDGNIIWMKKFKSDGNATAIGVHNSINGINIFGNIFNSKSSTYDAFMIKLNIKGELLP